MNYIIIGLITLITLVILFLGYKVYSLQDQITILQKVMKDQGKIIYDKTVKNDIKKEIEELQNEEKMKMKTKEKDYSNSDTNEVSEDDVTDDDIEELQSIKDKIIEVDIDELKKELLN